MIKYREKEQADFEQVLVIENECFKEPYPRKDLEYEFSENPVNKIIVAEFEGRVIGFIDFMITFNSSTIVQIAVAKDFRGQGIGTRLLIEMENAFPKQIDDKVETITLEVRESNEAAKALYRKNGYEVVIVKKNYYKDGENAIYMLKRL